MEERLTRVETDVVNLRRGLAVGVTLLIAALGLIWTQINSVEGRLSDDIKSLEGRTDKRIEQVDNRLNRIEDKLDRIFERLPAATK